MSRRSVKRMMKEAALAMLSVEPVEEKRLVQLLAGMHPDCRNEEGVFIGRVIARHALFALAMQGKLSLSSTGVLSLNPEGVENVCA